MDSCSLAANGVSGNEPLLHLSFFSFSGIVEGLWFLFPDVIGPTTVRDWADASLEHWTAFTMFFGPL